MPTKTLFVLIHIRNKGEVGAVKHCLITLVKLFYCSFQGGTSFVDPLCYLCFMSVMMSCLFNEASWSPAGMWCFLCFITFPYGVLGRLWYLIISIPDVCLLIYFECTYRATSRFRFNLHSRSKLWFCYVCKGRCSHK